MLTVMGTAGSGTASVLFPVVLCISMFSTQSISCFRDQNKSYANLLLPISTQYQAAAPTWKISTNKIQLSFPFLNLIAPRGSPALSARSQPGCPPAAARGRLAPRGRATGLGRRPRGWGAGPAPGPPGAEAGMLRTRGAGLPRSLAQSTTCFSQPNAPRTPAGRRRCPLTAARPPDGPARSPAPHFHPQTRDLRS